jgi:acyl-coenzyme A thioesterase PaaI-like protein
LKRTVAHDACEPSSATGKLGLDVHFVHRTRRIATVEARVRDGDRNLVAMGTGTFRIFEKRGDPIV